MRKVLKRIITKTEILYIIIIYIIFIVFAILTKPMTGIKMDVFIYPAYLSFLLCPSYLLYIKRHDSYITNVYCMSRINSRYKAYILRIKYLMVETTFFILPFTIILIIFNYILKANLSLYLFFLVFFHFIFSFMQIGIFVTIISHKWFNTYFASLFLMIILVIDYFGSLNYYTFNFEVFITPLLNIFTRDTLIQELYLFIVMLIRCVIIFLIGGLLFYAGNKKQKTDFI